MQAGPARLTAAPARKVQLPKKLKASGQMGHFCPSVLLSSPGDASALGGTLTPRTVLCPLFPW